MSCAFAEALESGASEAEVGAGGSGRGRGFELGSGSGQMFRRAQVGNRRTGG